MGRWKDEGGTPIFSVFCREPRESGGSVEGCASYFFFFVPDPSVVFSVLGFLSPANQGSVVTAMIVLYVWMGVLAGYASSRLYQLFKVIPRRFQI
jgi:hypothetical protein